MSDGGAEIGSKHEQPNTKRTFRGDEFAEAIAKIAVAQICERVGFQTSQQSALGRLSDIAVQYIYHIGKTANFYASLAGRMEGSVFDIIQGLEDLGLAQGFAGASDIDRCLASSGVVREIIKYVTESWDSPFAYAIPGFPVVKERNPTPSFLQIGEEPPSEDIPAWLPAFPDPQTYRQLPTENEGATDSHMEKIEPAKQQRKVERSLLNLQQQFASNGPEGPSSIDHGDFSKEKQAAESNPFLSAPLHFEEKEVSSVICPAKLSKEVAVKRPAAETHVVGNNHISVVETFAPAIEAMKNRLNDSEEEQQRVLLNQRSAVQFKIGVGKKPLCKPLQLHPQNKDCDKIAPWFGKDTEKDEKKRHAEKILRDCTEKTQELQM